MTTRAQVTTLNSSQGCCVPRPCRSTHPLLLHEYIACRGAGLNLPSLLVMDAVVICWVTVGAWGVGLKGSIGVLWVYLCVCVCEGMCMCACMCVRACAFVNKCMLNVWPVARQQQTKLLSLDIGCLCTYSGRHLTHLLSLDMDRLCTQWAHNHASLFTRCSWACVLGPCAMLQGGEQRR